MPKSTNATRVVFFIFAALLVVGVGTRLAFSPRGQPPEPSPAPAVDAGPATGCASTAQCAPGYRCVAPGACSRACKTNGDCPSGRSCGELRLMNPAADNAGEAATVTTCVSAGPG